MSFQADGKNMLILENGGKVMKDGLATKGPVSLALPYPHKSRIKQNFL